MMAEGFIGKINGTFIYLSAAMLCYSLQWCPTGNILDTVAFTDACSKGMTNNVDLPVFWNVRIPWRPGALASGYSCKPHVLKGVISRVTR